MNVIFGAAVMGRITLRAARAQGIEIECFADDFIGGKVLDTDVINPSALLDKKATFYLTSPNIGDMISRLTSLGFHDLRSCGDILRGTDMDHLEQDAQYSPEHQKYLVRTCLHQHQNYAQPERLTVQSVDLMVTEKCSMKCKDCSNLMQFYEKPEDAEVPAMCGMVDDLCAVMDEIYEVRVIGGEPFMHREVHRIVEHLNDEPKIKRVSIFTNATILPRDWKPFEHQKVRFFITEYDQSRKLSEMISGLVERGIAYVSERANGWTDCSPLDKNNRGKAANEALWGKCCAKNLATLADGRLYRCPFSANAFKLGAVPDYKDDYLTLPASRAEVKAFLREKKMIETCDHCAGRSYDAPEITPAIQTKKPLVYRKYPNGA